MKKPLPFLRSFLSQYQRFFTVMLLVMALMVPALSSKAQIYYTLNDGTASATSTDGVVRVGYDGSSATTLASGFTALPTFTAIDYVNNRAFVYEGTANVLQIRVVNLGNGSLTTTINVPTQVVALQYDAASDYIYYLTTASGSTLAAGDALRKVKPDGSNDQLVLASITASPKFLALDLTHGQVIVEDVFISTYIMKAINISNGNSTTLISNTTPITAIAYSAADNFLYYLSSDGSFTSNGANDALVRMRTDGTEKTTIASSIAASAVLLAVDAGNKRAFVYDGAGLSPTVRTIRKIDFTGAITPITNIASLPNSAAIIALNVPQAAVVSTTAASSVTGTSANVGGNITSTDKTVTERGVVYSSSNTTPVVGTDTKATNGSGSGSFSGSISGLSGGTTYYLRAYATSSAGTSYGAVISFATASNNANLSGIALSAGSLSPSFSSGTISYTAGVPAGTTSITITPTKSDANATIKVNGTTVSSGTASGNLSLNIGDNTESIVVTAQDGTTTKTYTVTVNRPKASQIITFNALPAKTYGNGDFAPGATASSGLAVSYSSDNLSVATIVGGNIHIVAAGTANITASQGGDANNAAAGNVSQALTVSKAAVTVTANAQSSTYGDADPSLTYSVNSGALATGDSFTGSLTRNAGTASGTYAITQGSLALNTNNYTLTYIGANLTINKRPITIMPQAQTKVYGDPDPAYPFNVTSGSLVNGDSFTGSFGRAAGEGVGTYALTIGTKQTTTDNYNITFVSNNLTITPKAINVTANAQSKTYGAADPAFTYSNDALVGGDSFSGTLTRDAGEGVGTYAITKGTLALSSNYTLNYTGANLTIGAKTINVTANAQSKTYGDPDPSFTYTNDALSFGDSFSGTLTRDAGEGVGSYAITKGSLALNSNYTINFTGAALAIGAKTVTVTANAQSKSYGAADPVLTFSSVGLVNGDAVSGALTRDAGEAVGTYAITPGSIAVGSNYTLSYVGANLTIGKSAITVTANNTSKQFGDADPALSYTVTSGALVNGDQITGELSRDAGEALGNYAIKQNTLTAGANYDLTYAGAFLTVTKRAVNVTGDFVSKIYGDADPDFTYHITSGSLLSSDHITGSLVRDPGEVSGNYSITQGSLAIDNSNYTFSYLPGNLAINHAQLTITADNKTKQQGDENPVLTYTATGFKNGDNTSSFTNQPTLETTAATNSPAGDYTITARDASINNYDIDYVAGTLTITPVSHDATLSALSVSGLPLSPDFDPSTTFYEADAGDAGSVSIAPTLNDLHSTLTVNGVPLTSGSSFAYTLSGGSNYIQVGVVAQDGTTSNTYTVLVSKNRAVDATLASLNVDGTPLPSFDTNVTHYTYTVPYTEDTMTIEPTPNDPHATVTVQGSSGEGGNLQHVALAIGTNTVTVRVRAEDPSVTKTYTLTVTRAEPIDVAKLASITLNPAAILVRQAATSKTVNYSTSVDPATTTVTVTPVSVYTNETIKVQGMTVASGSASTPIALNADGTPTTITTVVTAADGVTYQNYKIVVSKTGSSQAGLSAIALTPNSNLIKGTNTAALVTYTTSVDQNATTVSVTPTALDATATIRVEGNVVASGTASPPVPLNPDGTTTINTVVTAADSVTIKTYSIAVSKSGSNNATLASLKTDQISQLVLVSTNADVANYTMNVPVNLTSIGIIPTAADPNATIYVSGQPVASGSTTQADLTPDGSGSTTIYVYVAAQDGVSEKLYILKITRTGSNNANILSIALNPTSTLVKTPSTGNVINYNASVDLSVNSVTVKPRSQDVNATVTVNGVIVPNGAVSDPVTLNATGATTILVNSLAQDGVTTKGYTVTVTKSGSSNTTLSSLTMDNGSRLVPGTHGNTVIRYTTTVDLATTTVGVTPTAENSNATIKVNGVPVVSGTSSGPIALNADGTTSIDIQVTAPDGTIADNYIVVSKGGSNNALATLKIDPAATLILGTHSGLVLNYSTSVPVSVTSVKLSAKPQDANATVTINGDPVTGDQQSAPIALNDGPTTITTVVTAQDGVTTKTYILVVNRTGSNNAVLTSLKLTPAATLSTTKNTTAEVDYSTRVDNPVSSVTVTPKTRDAGATVTVNGSPVVSGTASDPISLNTGLNTITTVVTAEDGTVKTYLTIITRAEADAPPAPLFASQPATNSLLDKQADVKGVVVHSALSPNGDGLNDVLQIEGISKYPDNTLSIVNSTGNEVKQVKNYDNVNNVFDGRNKSGSLQKPGTYFYVLEYKDGSETKRKSGYIILKY